MKGFIAIEIPTKKYIKAYIIAQLGEQPVMTVKSHIGNKLYDVLEHQQNERLAETYRYDTTMKIYVNLRTWRVRGCNLNQTNLRNFNLFVENLVKAEFISKMNFHTFIFPSFEANLPTVREKLGIDLEAWSDDSMRKFYYRYRKKTGKPPLYKKVKEKAENKAF